MQRSARELGRAETNVRLVAAVVVIAPMASGRSYVAIEIAIAAVLSIVPLAVGQMAQRRSGRPAG
jgi:hypothetical protein